MADFRPQRATVEHKDEIQKMRMKFAAIDFGTTFCSLTFSVSTDEEIQYLEINPGVDRVPTALLIKDEVDKCTVKEFGLTAQQEVVKLTHDEHKNHHYFEFFKMQLHQEVSRKKPNRSLFFWFIFAILARHKKLMKMTMNNMHACMQIKVSVCEGLVAMDNRA